jgi:tRNA(Ile)-lysidine synthase
MAAADKGSELSASLRAVLSALRAPGASALREPAASGTSPLAASGAPMLTASDADSPAPSTASPLAAGRAVAAAVSGGADSAMLAVHAAPIARELGLDFSLFHVHHGLFALADDWADRVCDLGRSLGVPVRVLRVQVAGDSGLGIEAAARQARYAALAQAANAAGAGHILLAHHRDDQAETVLLRLLRGAGPAGLAAMAPQSVRDGIVYLRPWLNVPRARILQAAQEHAAATGWTAVDDPSNADARYTRAAVRTLLAPVLDARWPGWQDIVARHARLAAETEQILQEVAVADLAALEPAADGSSFSLAAWRQLSMARQARLLRHWLALQGARMPTEARLAELLKQLRQLHSLGHDRQLVWDHGEHRVRCVRGRVEIGPRATAQE